MDWIYLDNNATTQPDPAVVARVQEAMATLWANPSSVHRLGQTVRQQVELARASVAELAGAAPREIIFTSGGTESNNLALAGVLTDQRDVLITTPVEHSALRQPAEALANAGHQMVLLPVDRAGRVSPADLLVALEEHQPSARRILVSIQWANNETGVLQPMAELAATVSARRSAGPVLLHSDATQLVGKLPVDFAASGLDLMTLSGHKFHGPKGVGALVVRRSVKLRPTILGGPQERDRRGGTENTPAILGLGVAAALVQQWLADQAARDHLATLRDRLESLVCSSLPGAVVHGADAPRLWNVSNLGFPFLESEAILVALSERGLCASAGAACSSGSLEPSPVLLAMGIDPRTAHGSIRLSLSRHTTADEIDHAAALIIEVVERQTRQTASLFGAR